jgi:uroporphyrinogen decarboxylase
MVVKRLLENLARKSTPPAIWMMRQAGRYLPEYQKVRTQAGSFWNLCFTPELAAEVTLQPIQRFGFDAAIIFSDILVIPEALGQKVHFLENHGPQLTEVEWSSFLKQASKRNTYETLAPVYDALSLVKKQLPTETTLIGFSGTPWTLATYMIDGGKSENHPLSRKALNTPEFLSKLMNLLTHAVSDHLLEQIKAGVEVLQLFDSWASLIPISQRQQWIIDPLKQIVTQVHQKFPGFPILYFGRGIADSYSSIIASIPGIAVAADQSVDPKWLVKEILPKAAVQGNLDPHVLLKGGEHLIHAVNYLLEVFPDEGYIFNLGHGILPKTPIDHVRYVVDRVKQLRVQ